MKLPIALVSIMILGAATASAIINPEITEKMKKEAEERLNVKIVSVHVPKGKGPHRTVFYDVVVVGVERSKAKLKPGSKIRIEAYYLEKSKPKPLTKRHPTAEEWQAYLASLEPIVGPKAPPLLKKGWQGRVYLNRTKSKGKSFRIAVHGHSFE